MQRRGRGKWLLALGFLLGSSCAPVPPSSRIEVPVRQFSVSDVQLPSGLQVIIEDDPTSRVVASVLVVSAGAASDPRGQEGLAHLVEHLTFRARHPGQPSVASWLALHGVGAWNAETEMDLTSYYQVGAPEALWSMIDADIGRMQAPLDGIDEETFRAERGVVLAELRTRDESGRFQEVTRALLGQLFAPGHPYARGVGGTPESLSSLTLEQARSWASTYYRPGRMTWVLAGALDRAKVTAFLEQHVPAGLRDAAPGTTPVPPPRAFQQREPPPAPATLQVVTAPVSRPTLLVGWILPPLRDRMEPVLATLPALLETRWYPEGVNSVDAEVTDLDEAGLLALQLELDPDASAEQVWKGVQDRFKPESWSGGTQTTTAFIEDVFGQVRGASIVDLARRSESLVARTLLRARRARLTRTATTLAAESAAISRLTYRDVLEAGGTYVNGFQARAVLLKPGAAQESDEQNRSEAAPAFAPEVVRAEYPRDVVARFARGPRLANVTIFKASNGLEVVTVPEAGSGLVTVALGVRGGRLTSSPPALADRLRWAHQKFDYHEPAWIGATLATWWGDDSGYVEYRGSSGNLPNILAMLAERILTRTPSTPSKVVLARASATPQADAFTKRYWRAVLGEPGAKARLTTAEAAALDGDAAQAWAERILNPHTSTLVIVGDVKGNVKDEVDHWLGRWHGPEKATAEALPALPAAPGVLRVVKATLPQASQLRTRFGCTASARSLEEELSFRLLASELARQWNTIERETLGSSYGFDWSVEVRRDGTMRLLVSGRVAATSARRMTVAVSQTWKGLADLGKDESRLNRLRWEYARRYNVRFLTSEAIADDVLEHRLLGRPPAAVDEVPAALMRTGAPEVAAVGKQCQASAVLGLLGDSRALDVDAQLPKDAQVLKP